MSNNLIACLIALFISFVLALISREKILKVMKLFVEAVELCLRVCLTVIKPAIVFISKNWGKILKAIKWLASTTLLIFLFYISIECSFAFFVYGSSTELLNDLSECTAAFLNEIFHFDSISLFANAICLAYSLGFILICPLILKKVIVPLCTLLFKMIFPENFVSLATYSFVACLFGAICIRLALLYVTQKNDLTLAVISTFFGMLIDILKEVAEQRKNYAEVIFKVKCR